MSRPFLRAILAIAVCGFLTITAYSQSEDQKMSVKERFNGTWAGTFEGDATGKLEITVNADAENKHTGKISVTMSEGGSYDADFKSLTLEGDKLTAKYDDANGGEVTLEGTSDGQAGGGQWTYRDQGNVTANGSWKVTKNAQ